MEPLAGDLPGHRLHRDDEVVSFIPNGGGPTLVVTARRERRLFGRTEIAVFEVGYPPVGAVMRIEVRHIGRLKRSGLTARVLRGDRHASRLARQISDDDRLSAVALPLDFTRFSVDSDEESTRASIELMGASHVAIAFPPMRSYVRLYPDQRDALIGTFAELERLLARS